SPGSSRRRANILDARREIQRHAERKATKSPRPIQQRLKKTKPRRRGSRHEDGKMRKYCARRQIRLRSPSESTSDFPRSICREIISDNRKPIRVVGGYNGENGISQ